MCDHSFYIRNIQDTSCSIHYSPVKWSRNWRKLDKCFIVSTIYSLETILILAVVSWFLIKVVSRISREITYPTILWDISYAVRSLSFLRTSRYCEEKYVRITLRPREMIMSGYSCIMIFPRSGKILAMHYARWCACIDGSLPARLCRQTRAKCTQRANVSPLLRAFQSRPVPAYLH